MVGTRWYLNDEDIEDLVNYLYEYALLEQEAQRKLVAEWMKYAVAIKSQTGEARRVYLLPGVLPKNNSLICQHALARLLGMGPVAWEALARKVKNNEPIGHGLKGVGQTGYYSFSFRMRTGSNILLFTKMSGSSA